MPRLWYRKHTKLHDLVQYLKAMPNPDSSIMVKTLVRARMDSLDHDAPEGKVGKTSVLVR
jgi:hypothetical protein